jgi:hypothetical protein
MIKKTTAVWELSLNLLSSEGVDVNRTLGDLNLRIDPPQIHAAGGRLGIANLPPIKRPGQEI